VFNKVRAINKPSDLDGLKIRMMGNPIYVETMNALGGNGVPMGMDEVYNGIATGVVDGAENNEPTYVTHNLNSVAPYYSYTEHLIVPEILVFSKKIWEKLRADDQAAVREAAKDSTPKMRELWAAREKVSEEKVREAGVEIITEIDKKPFMDAMDPVYEKHVTSDNLKDLVKRIRATD